MLEFVWKCNELGDLLFGSEEWGLIIQQWIHFLWITRLVFKSWFWFKTLQSLRKSMPLNIVIPMEVMFIYKKTMTDTFPLLWFLEKKSPLSHYVFLSLFKKKRSNIEEPSEFKSLFFPRSLFFYLNTFASECILLQITCDKSKGLGP